LLFSTPASLAGIDRNGNGTTFSYHGTPLPHSLMFLFHFHSIFIVMSPSMW